MGACVKWVLKWFLQAKAVANFFVVIVPRRMS